MVRKGELGWVGTMGKLRVPSEGENREGWRGEEVKNNDQKKTEGKLDKNLEFGLHLQKTEL